MSWESPASIGSMANPIETFLDTRARRINGETKRRMAVEMQEADTGYGRCHNAG
jgi:hypothetical protein